MNRWKHFKIGDVVADPAVWGNVRFVIYSRHGNDYCPLLSAKSISPVGGKFIRVNLSPCDIRLVNASRRPLQRISDEALKRMTAKSEEARRELLIRTYQKCQTFHPSRGMTVSRRKR
nr:MAG TPA: hypothetical protein [Caudoviricetes sp.]